MSAACDIVQLGERHVRSNGGTRRCWRLVARCHALEGASAHILLMRWRRRRVDGGDERERESDTEQEDNDEHAPPTPPAGIRCGRTYVVKQMPGPLYAQLTKHADARRVAVERRRMEREVTVLRALAAAAGKRCDALTYALCAWRVTGATPGWCVAFERADTDLFDYAQRFRGLGFVETRRVVRALARALDHLHTHHALVHNDVKPENVLVTFEDYDVTTDTVCAFYKLTDYGATAGGGGGAGDDDADALLDAQYLPCTPYYAPPERTHNRFSPASDVWALGVLASEVVQGANVFATQYAYEHDWLPRMHAAAALAHGGSGDDDACQVDNKEVRAELYHQCTRANRAMPSRDNWRWLCALLSATVRARPDDRATAAHVYDLCTDATLKVI